MDAHWQITVEGMWDNQTGTISLLAKQVPRGEFWCLAGSQVPSLQATWDLELPPREDAHPAFPSMFGALQEVLQESRKTKQMALKIIPGSKKKKKNHEVIHQDCCSS